MGSLERDVDGPRWNHDIDGNIGRKLRGALEYLIQIPVHHVFDVGLDGRLDYVVDIARRNLESRG